MAQIESVAFSNVSGQGVVDLVLEDGYKVILTIAGARTFQVDEWMPDTAPYLFSKLESANRLTDELNAEQGAEVSALLRDVRSLPDAEILEKIGLIFPRGEYTVALPRLVPQLTMPGTALDYFATEVIATWGYNPIFGVGHWAATPYYRLGDADLGADGGRDGSRLGVALGVPLYPPTNPLALNRETVARYRAELRGGDRALTALAIGVTDNATLPTNQNVRYPRHRVVALFVLDGHHKLAAAAAESLPLQILTYFPHAYANIARTADIPHALAFLAGPFGPAGCPTGQAA